MTNNDELYFDTILNDFSANSVKHVYRILSKHVSSLIGTPEHILYEQLLKNEANDNSGIGNGVAIAQARLPRLTRPMIVFGKVTTPVNFASSDEYPVDMIALVLSPEFNGPLHLQRLSFVTRFLKEKHVQSALRKADDSDAVRTVMKELNHIRKAA